LHLPPGTAANLLRGQLGKILLRDHCDAYQHYFAPARAAQAPGPSGLRDLPRPFVLRVAELEGASLAPAKPFAIGINLFESRHPPLALFQDVLTQIAQETLGAARLERVEGTTPLELSLEPGSGIVHRLRVSFKTPTELKGADRPEFGVLFARIRDRVSALRALYGEGPLQIDFLAMGERARAVTMTLCDLRQETAERFSHTQRTGHPLGGFTGVAEYEGDLAAFLPYLEAARWTGVGRQTVWGKGEIHCEPVG
jgi:hypothetical protein